MILFGSTGAIRLITSAALAVDVSASVADATPAGVVTIVAPINSAVTTATTTSIAGAPTGTSLRNLKSCWIRNKGAGNQTVTIQHFDGSVAADLISVVLAQGERLEYDNDGWQVYDANGVLRTSTGGGYVQSQRVTASGNVTLSARTTKIRLRMVGGGGAGGSGPAAIVASAAAAGGGGGAGAYGEWWVAVSPLGVYAAVIGVAGAAGAAGAAGGAGGNTTLVINGITYQANGGSGGAAMTPAAATALAVAGGAGATAVTGGVPQAIMGGEPGDAGVRVSGTVGNSGKGGTSMLGPGAVSLIAQGNGAAPGTQGGGGGSGGLTLNGGATTIGGAGAAGIIIIEEYSA